jgi:hypothetical protein
VKLFEDSSEEEEDTKGMCDNEDSDDEKCGFFFLRNIAMYSLKIQVSAKETTKTSTSDFEARSNSCVGTQIVMRAFIFSPFPNENIFVLFSLIFIIITILNYFA